MHIAKNNIMKILVVGSFRWDMYAQAFYEAWRRDGYDVVKLDYEDFHYSLDAFFCQFMNKMQDRYHKGSWVKKYNRILLEKVDSFLPDLVFLYRCYNIYTETVKIIAGKSIVFSYNNDDPFSGVPYKGYSHLYLQNVKYCHLNYVYRKKNIDDFRLLGINNTKILLPYYRSYSNFPIDCLKETTIVFAGHFENDGRDKYILSLKDSGLPIKVYGGHIWKRSSLYDKIKDVVFPARYGEEYNNLINSSGLCLCFFSKINNDTYTRRCFEIPATKTVMLCEYSDDMNKFFPEGECAMYFRNQEELIIKARLLLSNPNLCKRIGSNAYKRVLELKASAHDRCREIINDYNSIMLNNN